MALKFIEGWDTYASVDQMDSRSGYLQWTGGTGFFSLVSALAGTGRALELFSNIGAAHGSIASNVTTGFIGCHVKIVSGGTGGFPSLLGISFWETASGVYQCGINLDGDGCKIVSSLGTTTANNVFPFNTTFFLEIGFVIDKTVGRLQVRVNGATVLTETAKNTAPSTTHLYMNQIRFDTPSINRAQIDNLYFCDDVVGAGTYACNNFLGEHIIGTLTADAATSTMWTPNTGGNASAVATANGDTSYNHTSTAADKDMFNALALPSNASQIVGVQVTGQYRKEDATTRNLTQRVKAGGVEGVSSSFAISTSYAIYSDLFVLNPSTGASWTPSALAAGAIQFGYRLEP